MRKSLFKHLTDRGIQVRALVINPHIHFHPFAHRNAGFSMLSLLCLIFSCVAVVGSYGVKSAAEFLFPLRFQVYIWVLNDEEDFQRAFDLGATGVMTDFPSRLKDFMDRNGISKLQWQEKLSRPAARPCFNVTFWSCVLSLPLVIFTSSFCSNVN